jgi:hypothetical protein
MRRLLSLALILASPATFSQTTLDITLPGATVCSYATGSITNGSVPGHLQATATSSSGAGCGSGSTGNVTFGPASPATASPATLSSNTGTSNITFQALNASSCTGAITPSVGATLNGGNATLCSGTTACQNPVTVAATFDNESTTLAQQYNVTVTCTGPSGQAPSTAVVTAQKKGVVTGGACFSVANDAGGTFTQATALTTVTNFGDGSRHTADPTSFDSAFLHAWPGLLGEQLLFNIPSAQFYSLAFTVPAGYSASHPQSDFYGLYSIGQSGYSVPVSMTISTKCGDFSNPVSGGGASSVICYGDKVKNNGFLQAWYVNGNGTSCNLVDGKQYFLNLINADITGVVPNGGGTAHSLSVQTKCPNNACANPVQIQGNDW